MELEGQIRQLQQMLRQQKEAEEELVARIGKLQEEKRELQDRLANFQRSLAGAEQNKRELERAHVRLEKDKKALRNTLDKVRQCAFACSVAANLVFKYHILRIERG